MATIRIIDEPWPLRIMAIALLSATYFFSVKPLMDSRADLERQTADLTLRTGAAERTLRDAGGNLALARVIRRELGNVRLDVDENTALANLLVDVEAASNRSNVAVLGIEPVRAAAGPGAKDESVLGMHVRGRFGDLLHFTGDLSMLRSLVAVRSLSLVRDARTVHAGAAPYIDGDIKIAVIRAPDERPSPSSADALGAKGVAQ